MELILILIIILLVIFIVLNKRNKSKTEQVSSTTTSELITNSIEEIRYPYKKKMLLTKAEYSFYQSLKQACDSKNFLICPKVRMEDFLEVTDKQNYMKYRGYIKSRHIDFMICDSKLHLIAGIELDDNTHEKKDIQKTDDFKNGVFNTINLPLYRVKMSDGQYNENIDKILNELSSLK